MLLNSIYAVSEVSNLDSSSSKFYSLESLH